MIILTVKEHTFKAGSSFDDANIILEESDFNNLDIERNFDLLTIERDPDCLFFEKDITVRFYFVEESDGMNPSHTREQIQEIIQDNLLIDAYLEDLPSNQDYWIECFADIPVGKHTLDLSFNPPAGENAEIVFYGSKPYMEKTLLEWHEVQDKLVTDKFEIVFSHFCDHWCELSENDTKKYMNIFDFNVENPKLIGKHIHSEYLILKFENENQMGRFLKKVKDWPGFFMIYENGKAISHK